MASRLECFCSDVLAAAMGRGDPSIAGCASACSKQAGTTRRRGCRQQVAEDQSERLISRSNFTGKRNGSSPERCDVMNR
jgi:hypothetical protein